MIAGKVAIELLSSCGDGRARKNHVKARRRTRQFSGEGNHPSRLARAEEPQLSDIGHGIRGECVHRARRVTGEPPQGRFGAIATSLLVHAG